MKISDALDFLKKHGDLKGWDDYQITNLISNAIKHNSMTWSTDTAGNINGIVVGKLSHNKIFYVVVAAVTTKGLFKNFIKKFQELFPGYKLVGYRRRRIINFTDKISLIERL